MYAQQLMDTMKVQIFPNGGMALYAFEKNKNGVVKK